MSSLIFPAIAPDYMRELSLGDFGIKIDSIYGGERRTVGTKSGIGSVIKFEYKYRTAAQLNTIIGFYKTTRGQWASFNLPISLWRQPEAYTDAASDLLEFASWRFKNPISIETVKRDVYNFDVELCSVTRVFTPEPDSFPCNIL